MQGKFEDLSGRKYNKLTVICKNGKTNGGDIKWLCKCDCGNEKTITGSKLKSGWTKSCGCMQKEWAANKFSKHKLSQTQLYKCWERMKSRCLNKNNNRYYRYGGRNIKVCSEWLDFNNFSYWALSNGYKEGLTIERIDVNGNYEPNNCTWITPAAQMRNTSRTVWVEYKNSKICMAEFSRMTGISVNVIRNRLKKGLTADQIVEEYK